MPRVTPQQESESLMDEMLPFAKHLLGPSGTCQYRACFGQESSSSVREHDAAANAIKQLDAVTLFKRGNRRACSRLSQVQLASGLGDVLLVGDRYKDPELFEGHDPINL